MVTLASRSTKVESLTRAAASVSIRSLSPFSSSIPFACSTTSATFACSATSCSLTRCSCSICARCSLSSSLCLASCSSLATSSSPLSRCRPLLRATTRSGRLLVLFSSLGRKSSKSRSRSRNMRHEAYLGIMRVTRRSRRPNISRSSQDGGLIFPCIVTVMVRYRSRRRSASRSRDDSIPYLAGGLRWTLTHIGIES